MSLMVRLLLYSRLLKVRGAHSLNAAHSINKLKAYKTNFIFTWQVVFCMLTVVVIKSFNMYLLALALHIGLVLLCSIDMLCTLWVRFANVCMKRNDTRNQGISCKGISLEGLPKGKLATSMDRIELDKAFLSPVACSQAKPAAGPVQKDTF